MTADAFFLRVLQEIDARIHGASDEYEMVRVAGLLRMLLIDGNPLFAQVNKARGKKLLYVINAVESLSGPPYFGWFLIGAFAPNPPWKLPQGQEPLPTISLSRERFLEHQIAGSAKTLEAESHKATVRDFIKHAANYRGGVHFGDPIKTNSPFFQNLESHPSAIRIAGLPIEISMLLEIAAIVLDALEPLRKLISEDTKRREY